jgi:dienelactone hydrolase
MKKPAGNGSFPAVVLMHGCGGIQAKRDNRWAERLLSWGYVTLEVDSLGPRGISNVCTYSSKDSMDIIHRRVNDAYDAKKYLADLPFIDQKRIAIMGWSHGGVTTLESLDRNEENPFRVAVAFYPSCRISLTGLNAPLLILIGEADDWTPAGQCVSAMPKEKTLPEIALKVYPGAFHGFDILGANYNVQGSNGSHHLQYNPEAEADSIIQVKAFFEKYLWNK